MHSALYDQVKDALDKHEFAGIDSYTVQDADIISCICGWKGTRGLRSQATSRQMIVNHQLVLVREAVEAYELQQ